MYYILPLCIFLFFVYYLANLIRDINFCSNNKNWKKAEAVVKDSRIKEDPSKKINKYKLYFYAIYEIDGVTYGVDKISHVKSAKALSRKSLKSIIDSDKCEIYYNPDKIHESSLVSPSKVGFFWRYLVSLLLILLAVTSTILVL